MFVGTMRNNLDPFGRYDDVTIWASLEAARLAPFVSGLEGKLDAEVSHMRYYTNMIMPVFFSPRAFAHAPDKYDCQ